MNKFLLDTSVIAGYLLSRKKSIHLVTPLLEKEEAATSIIVYGEVAEYVKRFASFADYRDGLQALLEHIHPYPLTYSILERYADVRRKLRPPYGKGLIGDIDTLIAATALEHDLTLLTIDTDFERVPHLKWQLVNLKAA
jgi:predicted nucleic acid-binding protein